MTDDDDDGAAIRRLKLNDIRDVIKEKTRRLSCQLPCPANRCACCRRIHFDPPGSKTGGPISGGPFFSRAPSEPEAHKHAFKKRGYTPLSINGVHKPWRVHTQHGWHRRKDGENTIRRRDHTQLAHIFQLTRGML